VKKLFVIALLALCLTALVGVGASGAGGNAAGSASAKEPFVYQMSPGDYADGSNDLPGLWQQGYRDVILVINMGPGTGTWNMTIEDCCLMGDTMLAIKIGAGGLEWGVATSPDTINLGPVSMPAQSWALVITGYVRCPGGFPAGYYWYIWM